MEKFVTDPERAFRPGKATKKRKEKGRKKKHTTFCEKPRLVLQRLGSELVCKVRPQPWCLREPLHCTRRLQQVRVPGSAKPMHALLAPTRPASPCQAGLGHARPCHRAHYPTYSGAPGFPGLGGGMKTSHRGLRRLHFPSHFSPNHTIRGAHRARARGVSFWARLGGVCSGPVCWVVYV